MNDKNSKKLNVLTVLVAVMLAALAAQSVAIYNMSSGGDNNKPSVKPEVSKDKPRPKTIKPDKAKPRLNQVDPSDNAFFKMNMDEWDPFKEMHAMRDRIDQMFGSAFNRFHDSDDFGDLFKDYSFSPDMNVEEKPDKYIVTMDLPGTDDSSVKINLEGQTLTVAGESESSKKQEDKGKVIMQERRSGKFQRSVTLPGPVKAEDIKSETKDGVLHIEIPKAADDG